MGKIKYKRLPNLLSPLFFNQEKSLFLLDDNALGFGFICEPIYVADDKVGERLNVLLNQDWPTDSVMQIALWTSPDIEKTLYDYCNIGIKEDGILGHFRKDNANFLRKHTTESIGETETKIRNIQCIFTIRIPIKKEKPSKREWDSASSLQKSIQQALISCGFRLEVMTAEKYIRVLSTIVNQNKQCSWKQSISNPFDSKDLIRNQVFDFNNEINTDRRGIWLGKKNTGTRIKSLSIKRLPEHSVVGMARRFLVEPLTGSRGIPERTLITASIVFPDTESARGRLEQERQWVTKQAYGPMLKWSPRLADKKYSYDTLFEALSDGDRIVKIYLGVTLFTDKDREESAVSNAIAYFREGGYQLMEDKCINLPLFLTNIPFGADPKFVRDSFRFRTMATRHAATQLPIFGGWKGTHTPMMTFIGRDGQLMTINLFDSTTGYNCVIAARTGSGKSFLTNNIILSTLSAGGRAWVIDVGRSYEKLTDTVPNGQFIEFNDKSQICLNPFDIVRDYKDEADMLCGIIGTMAAPKGGLDDFQTAGVQRVMSACWSIHGRELTIDILADAFKKEEDRRLKDIGEQLFPFTSKGEHGRYFSGRNNVSFSDRLAVIELEELKGRKHLQQVVLFLAVYQINQDMYLGKKDRPKVLIIDEAWDLLKDGDMSLFIMTAYRRIRKYGGSALICTQGLEDLYESSNGRAIAENATNKFLLRQAPETIMALEENKRLDIGEFGFKLMKTVTTVEKQYSEIFFITEHSAGVGRLIVTPFMQFLYTTQPKDVNEIQELRDQGVPLIEAIQIIMKRRGIKSTDEDDEPMISLPLAS